MRIFELNLFTITSHDFLENYIKLKGTESKRDPPTRRGGGPRRGRGGTMRQGPRPGRPPAQENPPGRNQGSQRGAIQVEGN
jgi:hypothetical protein